MTPRRKGWIAFAAGSAAALAALGWVTAEAVRLERETVRVRGEAAYEERVRLALWRMDSYLAPILAEESSRPHFHYSPFYPAGDAYTRYWSEILPGEVLVPSPLLTYRAPHVRLHFELAPDGKLRSPRVPEGNMRDNAEAKGYLDSEEITRNGLILAELKRMVSPDELRERAAAVVKLHTAPPTAAASPSRRQMAQSFQEYNVRMMSNVGQVERQRRNPNVPVRSAPVSSVRQGAFVALWIGPEQDNLVLVRSADTFDKLSVGVLSKSKGAERGQKRYVQGVWLDWPRLRGELLSLVRDLFPTARLGPGRPSVDDVDVIRTLASIPALLESGRLSPAHARGKQAPRNGSLLTPTRVALAAAWAALGGAILAAGLSLRAANDLSERRARFVSAVTHELRTPLTTFRLYADMLESGMVAGASRLEYLATLRRESERLSLLVENVLAYSRLEEGGAASGSLSRFARRGGAARERKVMSAGRLVESASARSRERAEACGMRLSIELAPEAKDAPVPADEATVEQIVFNLVDNACKHAAPEGPADEERKTIRLGASVEGRFLAIRLRDRGPGIPPSERKRLFEPFARSPETTVPGVGLGLALSRSLARAAGGELTCEDPGAEGGALFVLRLPLVR